MKSLKTLIEECENGIRSGQIVQVQHVLKMVNTSQVIDNERVLLANICRRVGLFHQGLRLLAPLVREDRKKVIRKATEEEVSEYAVLLLRVGATNEALKTLEILEGKQISKSYLYKAFCHFNQWDYHLGIQPLKDFLELETNSYQILVAQMNLAAAYFYCGDFTKAEDYLVHVYEEAQKQKALRLQANSLEMYAHLKIEMGHFQEAKSFIQNAKELLSQSKSFDQLFIEGCEAYLKSKIEGKTKYLIEYRQEAIKRKRYESIREADWYLLRISPDQELFNNLYFGTPYSFLRQRIVETTGFQPKDDSLSIGQGSLHFDLIKNEISSQKILQDTQSLKVVSSLLNDFYRPKSTAGLFNEIFPEEYYNPEASPHRIRQIIYRTREWLETHKTPLVIKNSRNLYHFQVQKNFRITLPKNLKPISSEQRVFEDLKKIYGTEGHFTFAQAREQLKINKSKLRRSIQEQLTKNKLEKFGAGPNTQYLFVG